MKAPRPAGQLYAGIARRSGAYLVDVACLYLGFVVTQLCLIPLRNRFDSGWMKSGPRLESYTSLTISLPVWLYFALSDSSSRQASFGKRLLGLRVASLSNRRISFGRALLRTVIKLLPWELSHVTVNLPTPMLIDPQTGEFGWARGEFRSGFIVVYVLLGIYFATTVLTPRKQSVHDLVAGTIVVSGRST